MKKQLFSIIIAGLFITPVEAETVFITLEKDNAIAVVDPVEGVLSKTVEVGRRPRGIALSPDNKVIYVAVSDDNVIKMLDAESLQELGTLPSGDDPETFA